MRRILSWLEVIAALRWRTPFFERPKQLGSYVRYTGPYREAYSNNVLRRVTLIAQVGGLDIQSAQKVEHRPTNDPRDVLTYVGSVGWKVKVR